MTMKPLQKDSYLVWVLFWSIIPIAWLFMGEGLWHTHDGLVHIPRIAAFYRALMEGHIPPRVAGYLNYGYGMPLFIFIYHIPYYVSSLFITLGLSLADSFRLALSITYPLSGIAIYLFGRSFFENRKYAFWMFLFYQFAPYRFVDLHMRGSFGESYTYIFLPLALWGLTELFKTSQYRWFIVATLSTAFLIMSHNSISLAYFGILCLFTLVFAPSHKGRVIGIVSLIAGVGLSAWYWLPAIVEHKYTYGDLLMKNVYVDHFVPWYHYIVPNFYNMESFIFQGIMAQFGIFHIVAILFAIVILVKQRGSVLEKKQYAFGLFLLVTSIFLMQPVSTPLWKHISLLRQFQFPWRFLAVVVFATSFLSTAYLSFNFAKNRRTLITIAAFVAVSTVFYWVPQYGHNDIDEAYYWDFPLNTTYYGETDVIWSAGPAGSYPSSPVQVIDGYATVTNIVKKGHIHTFTVDASESARLVDNTQYFPGWRVYVDGEKTPVEFQDQQWRGLVTFAVPDGKHDVRVVFGRTPVRLGAEIISIVMMGVLIVIAPFFQRILNHEQ